MIRVDNLELTIDGKTIVDTLSFSVAAGEKGGLVRRVRLGQDEHPAHAHRGAPTPAAAGSSWAGSRSGPRR